MHHRARSSTQSLIFSMVLVLALALVFSCSDQPTGVKPDPAGGCFNGTGKIVPGAGGSFLLGTACDTVRPPGRVERIEVWANNIAFDSTTGIVSFDVRLLNNTERNLFPTIHFVITNILPDDVALVGFDGTTEDAFPFMDFSAKLGSDNVLSPGERTDPVTIKFHTVTARSFAINFRIDFGPVPGLAMIEGVVFRDDNQNGVRDRCDRCEPGIPDITVVLQKNSAGARGMTVVTQTGANGQYRFTGLGEGVYTVAVIAPAERFKLTSKSPLLVTLVKGPDGIVHDFTGGNFGLFPLVPPPTDVLFGPVIIGPESRFGTVLDSTFVNPPSPLPVVFTYVLDVTEPPWMRPTMGVVDSAEAWINGQKVFDYHRSMPPDSMMSFQPQTIKLPEGLVTVGENTIKLLTMGDEHTALLWRVRRIL